MAHSTTYDEVGKEAVTDETEIPTSVKQNGVPATKFLTGQIMLHYQTIKEMEARLGVLFESQENCIKNVAEDNDKFIEAKRNFNYGLMFQQISYYTKKLNHLRSSMANIDERVAKLKYRTRVIKETQERRSRRKREEQERREELERLLTAKPVWEVDSSGEQNRGNT